MHRDSIRSRPTVPRLFGLSLSLIGLALGLVCNADIARGIESEVLPAEWRETEDFPESEPLDAKDSDPARRLGEAWFGGERGPKVFGVEESGTDSSAQKWPNISEPGPDMGDFPNSAFTLPKGRSYFEFSPVSLAAADEQNPSSYAAPFLWRYGLTNDVEFRLFGNGLTHVGGSAPSTGFSPLALDLKVHLWDDRREWLLPAMSIEAYLQTPWGSPQFDGGYQPSLNLNFDLPLTNKTNLEWTFSFTGVQEVVNLGSNRRFVPRHGYVVPLVHRQVDLNLQQFGVQCAIEHEVNENLQVFIHGYHNGAILYNLGSGEMVGVGGFWKFSDRWMAFGSVNHGLSESSPPINAQIGFAVAWD